MRGSGPSIVLSFVALAMLAFIRFVFADAILDVVPGPYGAGLVSTLGVLMVIAIAVIVDRVVRLLYWNYYLLHMRKRHTPALIQDIFTIALVVLGTSIGLYFEAGVSFTGLLTASGATAIVLGIALQTIIQDVFSGLSLNMDGSYAIGDCLTVYSDQFPDAVYGRVEGITWRTTYLRLNDGARLMVPNHTFTSNPVMNHSRPPGPKRYFVEIPVDNRFPIERATSILLGEAYRIVRAKPLAASPAPDIIVDRFDSDSCYFRVRFYADPNDVDPKSATSIMAVALHSAMRRHSLPSPVSQIEFAPPPDNFEFELAEAHDALTQVPLFKDVLADEQFSALLANCIVQSLPAGTVFIRQGDEGASMFIVLEGAARVALALPDGETRDVAVLVGGDVVGEMSLMTGVPRTATVTTLTSTRLLEIPKQAIEPIFADSPNLLERFSFTLAARQLALTEIARRPSEIRSVEMDILKRMRAFFAHVFR